MNSRERISIALRHQEADRIPLDLGGCGQTGMQVSTVYALRQALKLDPPGTPVKVIEPFQMLGEIKPDLQELLGVDCISVGGSTNFFGFRNEGWKPWTTFDGTPVLVPELFNTEPDQTEKIYQYPQGDRSAPPCAVMPKGGYYFDSVVRQNPLVEELLDPADNTEEFQLIPEDELAYLKKAAEDAYKNTDKALVLGLGGMAFGDIALVPGPTLKHPKGIRDMEEWYISTVTRKEYVYAVFERQCEIALENLPKIFAAVGNLPSVAWVSGTDFGAQNNCFISPKAFRSMYKPFMIEINHWIHTHTTWKTFIHTCGSIMPLIPDIIEAGFDILNPVQISAVNMDPQELKNRFGDQITFWGGGIDTQRVLPFGTAEEVRQQVQRNIEIFGKGGGYVFNPIHNVQSKVPVENLLAMYETVKKFGRYL
ncbi:uroporphyrinogen decarboxylase family protein [Flexilinea flocculi]|uniref:Uroporphyrinogen decarboxylase n=1 Tax=Flexilinea flocculi TaxID=1678840 RepID=A0A0K8PAZ2_9CHLR|nr:uroporphyrinogen decarboxylase family protein [Flexilinea flocculi]GAP39669.1 uroporphyrinogen decarboxylase [Flexilinea flocculi]